MWSPYYRRVVDSQALQLHVRVLWHYPVDWLAKHAWEIPYTMHNHAYI